MRDGLGQAAYIYKTMDSTVVEGLCYKRYPQ